MSTINCIHCGTENQAMRKRCRNCRKFIRNHDGYPPRYKVAYDFHESGMTYKEIGEKMGVSSARARQLALSYEGYLDENNQNNY